MKKFRAVVVEDNPNTRELLATTLESKNVETTEAANAEQAEQLVKLNNPHLLVIDIMLPGQMDGVELCRKLRKKASLTKTVIVLITGADSKTQSARAYEAGADILIPKPFLPKDFWRQVEELLKSRYMRKKSKGVVFLLDDDPGDCGLAHDALTEAGYEVIAQKDVRAAFQAVKDLRPDIVLIDIYMPQISGEDFARIVAQDKNLRPKPSIVLYSNMDRDQLKKICVSTGAHGFVCKVDGPKALVSELARVRASA